MLRAQSPLGSRVRVRSVRSVPVTLATLPGADDNYLRKTPGLYPDLLSDRLRTHLQAGLWHAFWVEVTPEGAAAGNYEIQLQLLHADTGEVLSQASACVAADRALYGRGRAPGRQYDSDPAVHPAAGYRRGRRAPHGAAGGRAPKPGGLAV